MTKFNVLFSIQRNRYANSLAPSRYVCFYTSREYELAISLLALQIIDQLVLSTYQSSSSYKVTFLVNSFLSAFLLSALVGNNRFFKVFVKFYQYCQATKSMELGTFSQEQLFLSYQWKILEPLFWLVLKHVDIMEVQTWAG